MFTAGNIKWTLGQPPAYLASKPEVLGHFQTKHEVKAALKAPRLAEVLVVESVPLNVQLPIFRTDTVESREILDSKSARCCVA